MSSPSPSPGSSAVHRPTVVRRRPPDDRAAVPRRSGLPRVVDLLLAGLGLVVLAPLMVGIAVIIRCTSRGPALFRQQRLGRDRRPFSMLKFRTMYAGSDDRLHREFVAQLVTQSVAPALCINGLYKLADDPRITPVGGWLRRTSMDELPQLINVLRGEMALVGPRPALPWEAGLFSPRHARRFEVLPGMTGLWQVSGRNRLTMNQALDLDVEYVMRQSLRMDCTILLRTVRAVLDPESAR